MTAVALLKDQSRWLSWALVVVVAVSALAYGAIDTGGPSTNAERTYEIGRTIRCPQCRGQSVAESDVAIAREIRADIGRMVDAGQTDQAIRQVFIDRYGPGASYKPSSEGLTGLVWIIPVVGGTVAVALLAVAFRRGRGKALLDPDARDVSIVEQARSARDS